MRAGVIAEPEELQLSFLVEREMFAWWGTNDPAAAAAALGIDGVVKEDVALALPNFATGAVVAARLPAALSQPVATVSRLAAADPSDQWGDSVWVWQRIARGFDSDDPEAAKVGAGIDDLPVAGHAGMCGDGVTIWSAEATVAAARAALQTQTPHLNRSPLLRPYQRAGVQWMLDAAALHGGAVLADEMGLGKTAQVLTVLAEREGPHLVVCPTSVLSTWVREAERFAPDLRVLVHAAGEHADLCLSAGGPPSDTVVLTSYGLMRTDEALDKVGWDTVVFDEAQQIKNPATATARRARALPARVRLAVTGTPVENRLDELWSLFAATVPHVLGPRARFRRRFATAIEAGRSTAAAARLHAVVSPHLLRRRKTEVAGDLPPRIESANTVAMTAEQEDLYRRIVDDAFDDGFGTGIRRRGRVLALITRLKQVCNHPELVAPTGAELAGRSGKLDRLVELLDEITSDDERALVFTQYRATAELLAAHLAAEVTGGAVDVLHGGLDRVARDRMVEAFSSGKGSPVLVLSLRAAGTGLNLTRASHVLHYDRWWNPAVEAQASDRVHRIGQERTVTVHTLTTARTLEEIITDMHDGKRGLAEVALSGCSDVGTDIARLGDAELREVLDPSPRRPW